MKLMTTILLVFVSLTKISKAQNSSAYELTCRAQAKEIAAESYRGCITENKKMHIDQLRSEYQQKLKSLKDEYDNEINKLTGKSANSSNYDTPMTTLKKQNKKSNKVSSRTLPSKRKTGKSSTVISSTPDEVTVQVKSGNESDDSIMDIPEPVPVEDLSDPST